VLPITLGTVLTAQGLLIFAGRQGWLNRFLIETGIIDQPLQLVNNYLGVMFSLIISGFPFAYLLISSYLSGIDPSLEAAARTLGANWKQRFLRVTLPLLAPGLATTFILTFVLAFSVFPSARLVGDASGETRVLALMAYRSFAEQLDYAMASTIAIMMGVVELIVVAIVLLGRSLLYKGSTGGKGCCPTQHCHDRLRSQARPKPPRLAAGCRQVKNRWLPHPGRGSSGRESRHSSFSCSGSF
jgi:putative spermidine/putrescine transport system permease protein